MYKVLATFPPSTVVTFSCEQILVAEGVATTLGIGFTITVAVTVLPLQPFASGVTVKITVSGALVILVNIPVISPLPFATIPVEMLLFLTQLKAVPATLPVKEMLEIAVPEQMLWIEGATIAPGAGFTSTEATTGNPEQPFASGVTV